MHDGVCVRRRKEDHGGNNNQPVRHAMVRVAQETKVAPPSCSIANAVSDGAWDDILFAVTDKPCL